ncbi:MAG: hypothetical protein SOZ95_06885 [Bacilli bacterium]|nr:hypothetical protein [Bacilli bacterium]
MTQIFKNRRFIFALTFFILIDISLIANVNALTDDNGNEIKCILQETGLTNLAETDYCLTFNQEKNGKKYAMYSYTEGSRNYEAYYETNFKKIVLDIREYNLGYDYIITIPNRYIWSGSQTDYNLIEDLKILSENNILKPIIVDAKYVKYNGVGLGLENFSGSTSSYLITKNTSFLIKDGIIQKMNNESNLKEILWYSRPKNIKIENIIYSDFDIYDSTGTTIIKPKEDFEVKKPIEEEIEIVKGEIGKNIKFKYNNLKENYLIDIKRKDIETKKNLEWKTNPIRPNITFSTIEFENLTDSYIFERSIYDENKNIIFQKEEIITFGGLFDELNENSGVSDYFGFIKIFLKKASTIISPIFEIINYFFNNVDPFMQLGIFSSFIILIIYFVLRGVRK